MNFSLEEIAYNIVTRREIAGRCNVHLRTMYGWVERRERNNFPEPLRRISGGSAGAPFEIYWWPQVQQWYDTYIPRRGPKVNNGAKPVAPVGKRKPLS